jgi:hypothetical protein
MKPLPEDRRELVSALYTFAGIALPPDVLIDDLPDGGMGSFRIAPFDASRKYGSTAAEITFHDADGVVVLASLYLDRHGTPLEIDLWRTDYGALLRWPDRTQLSSLMSSD